MTQKQLNKFIDNIASSFAYINHKGNMVITDIDNFDYNVSKELFELEIISAMGSNDLYEIVPAWMEEYGWEWDEVSNCYYNEKESK